MELQQIVTRYAAAIEHADPEAESPGSNARTGDVYRAGFKSLGEPAAVSTIDAHWEQVYPGERRVHRTGVAYPAVNGAQIDHVITSDGHVTHDRDEWGIEVKRLQFVGDNGKSNDYATAKVLSPYLKDRGLIHDALRLREHGFTERVAVVAYSFDYDEVSLTAGRRLHRDDPDALEVLRNIEAATERNGGDLRARPLIVFVDAILGLRGLTAGPRAEAYFTAWRHPAGGTGSVFGWEVRRPQEEPGYDPRHPW